MARPAPPLLPSPRGSTATLFPGWSSPSQRPIPSDSFAPTLIAEAAKIAPESPAYDTVFYHRVRLLTALKRTDEARALLDAALPALRSQKPSSKLNALLGERMAVARDFNEFLQFAPRTVLSIGSQGAGDCSSNATERPTRNAARRLPRISASWFDDDAADVLNRKCRSQF